MFLLRRRQRCRCTVFWIRLWHDRDSEENVMPYTYLARSLFHPSRLRKQARVVLSDRNI